LKISASGAISPQIYMPQWNGTTLEIFDLETETTRTVTLPIWRTRGVSQLWGGKLYMPIGGDGTTLEIFDLQEETARGITLPTNMSRGTSQLWDGKLQH
jgi:hypothetical protein